MKTYSAHVQFDAIEVIVRARTMPEAKRKIRARIAKMKPLRLLDRANLYVDPV
jgi:hypothetical protein